MIESSGRILNVFNEEELKVITLALEKLKDAPNVGNVEQAYTNGITKEDRVYYALMKRLMFDKLETVLGIDLDIGIVMHLKENTPWTVHSDTVSQVENQIAILVPLYTEGSDINQTHTIVFNQHLVKPPLGHLNDWTGLPKVRNSPESWYEEYCSHNDPYELDHLTLQAIYQWERGAAIYWNLNLVHGSDNFTKNGITMKSAIVMFGKYK